MVDGSSAHKGRPADDETMRQGEFSLTDCCCGGLFVVEDVLVGVLEKDLVGDKLDVRVWVEVDFCQRRLWLKVRAGLRS